MSSRKIEKNQETKVAWARCRDEYGKYEVAHERKTEKGSDTGGTPLRKVCAVCSPSVLLSFFFSFLAHPSVRDSFTPL